MESLNLNLSHSLFGLYKIIISSVAEKIGYIIELPSHTRSEWQSWVLNPTQHPLGREKRWGGWESVLTKSQDLGLQSGPTLLLIQLPVTLLCCFRKLGHRRAFCGSVCCLSGDHSCAPMPFLTFSHSSTGRITTEPPFDHLYLSSHLLKAVVLFWVT